MYEWLLLILLLLAALLPSASYPDVIPWGLNAYRSVDLGFPRNAYAFSTAWDVCYTCAGSDCVAMYVNFGSLTESEGNGNDPFNIYNNLDQTATIVLSYPPSPYGSLSYSYVGENPWPAAIVPQFTSPNDGSCFYFWSSGGGNGFYGIAGKAYILCANGYHFPGYTPKCIQCPTYTFNTYTGNSDSRYCNLCLKG